MDNIEQVSSIGIVLIGRNEGERLINCIGSINTERHPTVYVDSGSTDNSVNFCLDKGVAIVELDMSTPFTAARARNEGYKKLKALLPDIQFVQFIDGDCLLDKNWINEAEEFLINNPSYAAVCGRRKEIRPTASLYNMLCDIEWDTPIGETKSCGGDVLFRAEAFEAAQGYNDQLIAGEEPELCFRMRKQGWRIYRLDALMTLHDANITRFSQWWKRSKRAGYAYTKGMLLHGRSPERYYVRPVLRAIVWGAIIPTSILILGLIKPIFFSTLIIYPIQLLRISRTGSMSVSTNLIWAFFTIAGKFPELSGLIHCLYNTALSKTAELIEYK
jgi:GT2 family glycosyltransferase